jgi:hypothetical protein
VNPTSMRLLWSTVSGTVAGSGNSVKAMVGSPVLIWVISNNESVSLKSRLDRATLIFTLPVTQRDQDFQLSVRGIGLHLCRHRLVALG